MLGWDGSIVRSIEVCSTGFAEAAQERKIVFAATQPGRLSYGPDPAHLTALWQLARPADDTPSDARDLTAWSTGYIRRTTE